MDWKVKSSKLLKSWLTLSHLHAKQEKYIFSDMHAHTDIIPLKDQYEQHQLQSVQKKNLILNISHAYDIKHWNRLINNANKYIIIFFIDIRNSSDISNYTSFLVFLCIV